MSTFVSQRMADSTQATLVIPQLIVGLGNPGLKYDRTRHNVGFAVIDALARTWQIKLTDQSKFHGLVGEGVTAENHKVRLLKPLTYMNRSGQSIRAVLDWYKLDPESVLVIYDEMDLPVGRIRLRLSGSAGGHNGMKSAIAHLGTQNFPRLRVGIGSAKDIHPDQDTVSHVLGRFSAAEEKVMIEVIDQVVNAVELSLRQGVEKAMSLYNNRQFSDSSPIS
jgi:PTH1 family peptidyl-tRNA hydrolase